MSNYDGKISLPEQNVANNVANGNSQHLTEQWQKGTLEEGYYYTLLNDDNKTITINYCWDDGCFQDTCDDQVDEVLAPVPSYEQDKLNEDTISDLLWKLELSVQSEVNLTKKVEQLEKKLDIATKALKETRKRLLHVELSGLDGDNRQKMYDLMFEDGVIDKALKEMEEV